MRPGTQKLFKNEYKDFVAEMIMAAENGDLPTVLQLNVTKDVTLQDLQDLMIDFKRDTSFDIRALAYMCDECGTIHLNIEVTYSLSDATLIQ